MADISQITVLDGTTYTLKDSVARAALVSRTAAEGGTDLSLVTTGEKYVWNNAASGAGTITGITMNGSSMGTSGVVDLGTVITSHQDISGKADKSDTVLSTTLSRGRADSTTVGQNSFAFGEGVEASGRDSHAEGYQTTASGYAAHTEGSYSIASGGFSHAHGYVAVAAGKYSTVIGKENVPDSYDSWDEWESGETYEVGDRVKITNGDVVTGYVCKEFNDDTVFNPSNWTDQDGQMNYVEIVGNGINTTTGRSNARALDWDGNEYLKGNLFVGCNSDSSGGSIVAIDSNVVHTTGNETVAGNKTFTSDIRMTTAAMNKKLYFKHNENTNAISCMINVNAGHATNQTLNQMSFVEYSPKSTAATDNTGSCERYYLPAPTKGLSGDAEYDIYTSKNLTSATAESGGTDLSLVTTGDKYNWDNTVKLTGAQNIGGAKTFTAAITIDTSSRYKYIYFNQNAAEKGTAGYICLDSGNVTNQTTNEFYIALYAPKTTDDPANMGNNEKYYLPTPTRGLSSNKEYYFLTTKEPKRYLPLDVDFGTISGTGSSVTTTKTVAGAVENMRPTYVEVGTPYAVDSDIQITPGTNTVSVTMTIINGQSTTLRFVLQEVVEVTAT